VTAAPPTGVLLVQLGTPAAPEPRAVRRYLREFLGDRRVLDLPALPRWLLLHAVILPRRPRASAAAYRAIWTDEGSPLLLHSRALAAALARELGPDFAVELGMRYGEPALPDALERIRSAGAERVIVLPLFPQYAASSTGSALARVAELAAAGWDVPRLELAPPFFDDPGFQEAWAAVARAPLAAFRPDHVLLSYHGLPERQIRRSDPTGGHCLARADCCEVPSPAHRRCYRAQCLATSRALARALALPDGGWSSSFQSRLGRTPWIKPYTDEEFGVLARRGVKRLAVLCPAFVADCLETLEEIGIRGRAQWRAAGGDELLLVPSLNAHPAWVAALSAFVRQRAGSAG
jgi:protoporphyrin/coproporphyrin ferrochelatase